MTPYGKAPYRGTSDGTNLPTITYKPRDVSTPNPIAGAATIAKLKAVKVTFEDAGEDELQTNGNGIPVGFIDKKNMDSITLECIVQADTKANAAAAVILPGIYQTIALADFVADNQLFLNGDWVYTRGAKLDLSEGEDEDAKLTIPLKRYFTAAGVAIAPSTLLGAIV